MIGAKLLAGLLALIGVAALGPAQAEAHGLQLLGRSDLPVPAWLFAWAAATVLIVSFALLTVAWREPRLASSGWRPVPSWVSRALLSGPARAMAGAVGTGLLALVLWSGFDGTETASENFASNFVFVTFWLGLVPLSLLLGDVFRAFNPWWAVGRLLERGFELIAGQARPPLVKYPEWLGRWPAAIGVLGFLWLELVYGSAREGILPSEVATAALVYTLLTLAAMTVFGARTWIERGEAFSVFYRMISTLSPVEVREGRLGVRPPVIGSREWVAGPGSVALICVVIGGTIYDGALESVLSSPLRFLSDRLLELGIGFSLSLRIGGTLLLVACMLAVAAVFWLGVRGMRSVGGAPGLGRLGALFAHSLIPIAIAYLIAHYFSLFFFVEQAQFSYLLSDPLGRGWDLFGTAGGSIDYGSLSATVVWYVQVGALVVGHVLGLVLAHDRALEVYPNLRSATRSQYWMLAVMVAFTMLGLFLLSESNQ